MGNPALILSSLSDLDRSTAEEKVPRRFDRLASVFPLVPERKWEDMTLPERWFEYFSANERRLKRRWRSVQVKGRLAAMRAVDDSRMYQKVQSRPKGWLKL